MPTPSSRTATITLSGPTRAETVTVPSSTANAAFKSRFTNTCSTRRMTPTTGGSAPRSRTRRARGRSSCATSRSAASIAATRSTCPAGSSSNRPKLLRSRTIAAIRSMPARTSATNGWSSSVTRRSSISRGQAAERERVVDFVGDAGGHHPERREPVGVRELRAQTRALGHVARVREHRRRPVELDRGRRDLGRDLGAVAALGRVLARRQSLAGGAGAGGFAGASSRPTAASRKVIGLPMSSSGAS